jgi:AI-2 transport protein TqsA
LDSALQLLDRYKVLDGLTKLSGEDPVASIRKSLDVGVAMRFAGETVGALSGAFGNAFLIVLTVIFILLEASGFPSKLRALSGGSDNVRQQFDRIVTDVRRYVALKTLMCLATGVSVTIFLLVMGVDYPLMWGTLAFLLNYVPNIGSFIAAAPAVVLALVQFGWGGAAWTAAGYTVINVMIGNVVEPRVLGKGLGLSTLVVFVSLVFWGWVLGPIGMLLSAPLTMVVKIAMESQPDSRWIAILLSSDASLGEQPKGEKQSATN